MRTGAALVRHPDWRDALPDLIRPDTGPLRRAHMLLHPNSRPTHYAPSRMLSTTASIRRVSPGRPSHQACELMYWDTLYEAST
jgi:hypothetical protein